MSDQKNYTVENEARMAEVYVPTASQEERDEQINALAAEFGKNRRSIIAKLTTMGVYVKKTYTTKKGEKPVRKEALVTAIAAALDVADLPGLEKANKSTLVRLLEAVSPQEAAE